MGIVTMVTLWKESVRGGGGGGGILFREEESYLHEGWEEEIAAGEMSGTRKSKGKITECNSVGLR